MEFLTHAKQMIKKIDSVVLPLKFRFLGCTTMILRSKLLYKSALYHYEFMTLLYMSTPHHPVLQRQRRPRTAGERRHARHHRLLRPDAAHDGGAAL